MNPTAIFRHPRLLLLSAIQFLLLGFLTHLLMQKPQLALSQKATMTTLPAMAAQASSADTANVEDLYTALTSQPVFHTSRQLTPERPMPTAPESPPPAYILTGYLGLTGRAAHAYLQPSAGGRTLIIGLGDNVDGWMVVGVNPRQVELKQGDRSVSIGKDGNSASPSAGLSAPQAPGIAAVSVPGAQLSPLPSATQGAITLGNGTPASRPALSSPLKKPIAVTPKNPPRLYTVPRPAVAQHP